MSSTPMIKKVFPILAVSMFSSTLGIGIVAPLLPLYARDMGATGIWLGVIFAAYSISFSVVVPIASRLSDQRGRKLFLVIGLLAHSIISLGYVLAVDTSQLALVRLVHGIAGALTYPIATTYVGDLSPEGEEGKWMGYAMAAFWSGFGFGPFIGGVVTDRFEMSTAFYSMSGLNMLAFLVAIFFLPEVSRRKAERGFRPPFKEMSASGTLRGIFAFRLAEALGSSGSAAFLPILGAMIGLSTTLIGTLLTVNFLSWIIFTLPGGIISDRFNRRALTILSSIVFIILLAAISLTNSFWQLLPILLVQGISSAIYVPAISALAVEEGRKFGMGSAIGMLATAMSIGSAIGPIMSGGIVDLINIRSLFYIAAGIVVMGTSLFIWFTRGYR